MGGSLAPSRGHSSLRAVSAVQCRRPTRRQVPVVVSADLFGQRLEVLLILAHAQSRLGLAGLQSPPGVAPGCDSNPAQLCSSRLKLVGGLADVLLDPPAPPDGLGVESV